MLTLEINILPKRLTVAFTPQLSEQSILEEEDNLTHYLLEPLHYLVLFKQRKKDMIELPVVSKETVEKRGENQTG